MTRGGYIDYYSVSERNTLFFIVDKNQISVAEECGLISTSFQITSDICSTAIG